MTFLHVYFIQRNQQAFQRLLDGSRQSSAGGLSTSGGRSWNRPNALTMAMSCDVNARDQQGRTVLHLAAASIEQASLEFMRMLLTHPAINVNLADKESHWTALHRALYHGNIASARLLLQRSDTDISLKDLEGYTAFDLYNATLRTTKPSSSDEDHAELFTWGVNRNATLGLGDGDDRAYPDQVIIQKKEDSSGLENSALQIRFSSIHVKQVFMSRLHTVVVTSESRGNLRVCGFGSGGRLGPGQHTQYNLVPLQQFTHTIVSVALGQDHTLALTSTGEVLSWGLNRFSQLGYAVESVASGTRVDEPIQASPRKVLGALRKEVVRGVAACKTASACWTDTELFTWGTNSGQLGYDKAAQPVQIVPRKVTKVTQPVKAISMTDSVMACLLDTQDVVCIWNDRHFKINFPTHAFPSEIHVYRPPQAVKIAKLVSCDETFAALAASGELFIFSVDEKEGKVRPQRVWALRKQFSAVKDVALGADGSIIICTESGHVFVRSRNVKSSNTSSTSKTFKFQRVPYIQRATRVTANNTGAFGVLRVDHMPTPIRVSTKTLGQDLAMMQPYLTFVGATPFTLDLPSVLSTATGEPPASEHDDEGDDVHIQKDVQALARLLLLLKCDRANRKEVDGLGLFAGASSTRGADLIVQVRHVIEFPVHRLVLAARCPALCHVLSGAGGLQDNVSKVALRLLNADGVSRLVFVGCNPLSVLVLIAYLYSDELLALWDRRIATVLERQVRELGVKPAQVKEDLQILARLLDLPLLTQAMVSPAKRIPVPSMIHDMKYLFHNTQAAGRCSGPLAPDVALQLMDREVLCHSVLLRARSSFFAGFFDDGDWTAKRWDAQGVIAVDMKHMKWRVMDFVLRYVCCGEQENLFETLDSVGSIDEVLEFLFEVMACANELLMDRLVLLCSATILHHLHSNNVCYVLTDAVHLHANALVDSVQGYMAANMELLLESRMLDDLTPSIIKRLSAFVRQEQAEKSPVSRSNRLVDQALAKHWEWLQLQDIPQPIIPTSRHPPKDSPKLSPTAGSSKRPRRTSLTPLSSPSIRPSRTGPSGDDLFEMDDAEPLPALNLEVVPTPAQPAYVESASSSSAVWKGKSAAPRVDMKAIMAEAETSKAVPVRSGAAPGVEPTSGTQTQSQRTQREWRKLDWASSGDERPSIPLRSTGSPWKLPVAQPVSSPSNIAQASPAPTPVHTPPVHTTPLKDAFTSSPNSKNTNGPAVKPAPSTPPRSRPIPGLGPIFTPPRQSSSKADSSIQRRVASGSAWTLPPVQPVVESSPAGPSMSFVAIQQLQLDQDAGPSKDKRSLREIQEEEQARQVEADFLKWWTAEEERLKLETQAPPVTTKKKPKKTKPPKGKSGTLTSASAPVDDGSDKTRQLNRSHDVRRNRTKINQII